MVSAVGHRALKINKLMSIEYLINIISNDFSLKIGFHGIDLTIEFLLQEDDPQVRRNTVEATSTNNIDSFLGRLLVVFQLHCLHILQKNQQRLY